MKKVLIMLLVLCMLFSFSACGGQTAVDDMVAEQIITEIEEISEEIIEQVEEVSEDTETVQSEPVEEVVEEVPAEEATDGLRPEFKAAMDSYEAFYNEYCDFMNAYMANPADLGLLTKYAEFASKTAEMDETFAAWDESEMSNEELQYYLDVNNRVMQKLLEVGQ